MPTVETQDTVYRTATFSVPNGVRDTTSLLGRVDRGMRLVVSRDAPATSDIIELASRRCLVGSAPSCDVRVNEPGIAPIECLIFRGTKNNVVRWFDLARGFAGGEFFEDEILHIGDPLQVGPVELELLIDEIMEAEETSQPEDISETSTDRVAEYVSRLEWLEVQLHELQQASDTTVVSSDAPDSNDEVVATISALAAQLAVLQSRSANDRDLWAGEKGELEALLQSRLSEFDLLQAEVQCLRDELVTVRSEYGSALASEATSERLADVSQALAERTEDFERQQTNWERERSALQRQLQANEERLELFETRLFEQSDRQEESEAARQVAEARADRLQKLVEELAERLAEQQEEYESVRAQWETDQALLVSELAATKERLAQSPTTESLELELREVWNRERTELQNQIDASNLRLELVQEELETQRRRFHEEQQSRLDSQPAECSLARTSEAYKQRIERKVSGASHNPMDRLPTASSLGDGQNDEFEERVRKFTSPAPKDSNDAEPQYPENQYRPAEYEEPNIDEQPLNDAQLATYLNDAPDDEEADQIPLSEAMASQYYGQAFELDPEEEKEKEEEVAVETALPASPVGTADLLAQLGQSGAWDEDESDADDLRCAEPATVEAQAELPPQFPVAETPFNSSIGKDAYVSEVEEESIETYMARLMNRVRATDDRDEPFRKVKPTLERIPVTEYTEVTESMQHERKPEPEKFNPEEYKPRSQAPELADRMTAMRSLANDSARSAIASHAKRNWSSVMKLMLLVSVFAFVSVIASIVFFWGNPLLMGLGSLAGLGVLIYWARTAITYRKLLLASLMFEPEGGDHDNVPAEESAA